MLSREDLYVWGVLNWAGVGIIDSKAGNRGCKTEILCEELVEMVGGNRDFMQGIS